MNMLSPLKTLSRSTAAPFVKWPLRKALQLTRIRPGGLVRVDGATFEVFPASRHLILSGYYEHEEREAVTRFVDSDFPIVELGGSQGIVSCLANRILKDRKRHVVVEANAAVIPLLKRNRDRNRCGFEIVHAAAGTDQPAMRFFQGDDPLKSSALLATPDFYEVPCLPLSGIVEPRGFCLCTLICDIEGGEIGLVETQLQILRERFRLLVVEFHPAITGAESVRNALARLRGVGFEEIWVKRHVHVLRK